MTALDLRRQGGTEDTRKRKKDGQFFPTPPEGTRALILHSPELRTHQRVWEPAAGHGHLTDILRENGWKVAESDLILRKTIAGARPGLVRQDFLQAYSMPEIDGGRCTAIVTNPPYGRVAGDVPGQPSVAARFVEHALGVLQVDYLALLLKVEFWSADDRFGLFERFPPAYQLQLTFRLDFTAKGGPMGNHMWTVWTGGSRRRGKAGVPTRLVRRPPDDLPPVLIGDGNVPESTKEAA